MSMKVGEFIADLLRNAGFKHVFGVVGEHILSLVIPMMRSSAPSFINAAFEPGAGFMSVIYSRVTGSPGILMLISGPGILGAVNPIAMAYVEGDPLLVIATKPPRSLEGMNSMHSLPTGNEQLEILRPITKAQFVINKAEDVRTTLPKAINIAVSGKPGPVYVEVPMDLLDEDVTRVNHVELFPSKPTIDDEFINKVTSLLLSSRNPVILVGRGAIIANAERDVLELAEFLDAPICTTVMAKGAVDPRHPLYAGVAAGKMGNDVADQVLSQADLVLAIGVRFSEMGTGRYSMRIGGELIQVNIDGNDIGRVFKPSMGIVADAKDFTAKLLARLRASTGPKDRGTRTLLRNLWAKETEELAKLRVRGGSLIESWEVVDALRSIAEEDAVFIGDVGAHRIETFLMPIYKPRTYITTTGWVSMGLAVPGAIAAKIANPDRQVFGLVGDGGFLMTGLEVITGVRYNASAIIVVFNDSAYRVLRTYELSRYGTQYTYRLPTVNFAALAESLGAHGIKIEDRDYLMRGLENAVKMAREKPVVVDININPNSTPIPLKKLYRHF